MTTTVGGCRGPVCVLGTVVVTPGGAAKLGIVITLPWIVTPGTSAKVPFARPEPPGPGRGEIPATTLAAPGPLPVDPEPGPDPAAPLPGPEPCAIPPPPPEPPSPPASLPSGDMASEPLASPSGMPSLLPEFKETIRPWASSPPTPSPSP